MKNTLIKSTVIISLIAILSKILGLVRESALAAYFGANSDTDAYKIAYSIPGILFVIINAAISQTFIPIYKDYIKNNNENKIKNFLNNVITITGIITILLIIMCMTGSKTIVALMAPGLDYSTTVSTILILQIIMPFSFFIIISNLVSAYLQSHDRFITPALTALPYSIFGIFSIVFFRTYGIRAVAIGSGLSYLFMFLIQLPTLLKLGFKYTFRIDFKDDSLKTLLKLLGPVIISSSFSQVYMIINRILASSLDQGSISALDYANKINTIFYNAFTLSLATVLFPKLAENSNHDEKFSSFLVKSLRLGIIISLPVTIGLIVLRIPIVKFLFERGEFSSTNTFTTSNALASLSIGIIGVTLCEFLNKAFFALKDTRTPMFNGIIAILLNIAISLLLVNRMGLVGIALGTSFSAIISGLYLLLKLRKKISIINGISLTSIFVKSLLASIIMGICINAVQILIIENICVSIPLVNSLLDISISVISGILIYLLILFLFRVEEVTSGFKYIRYKILSVFNCKEIN